MKRVSKDPEVRMNEIMDTADTLFHEKGYRETSISDIVKANGVAQGTFYYHFKSKEAVLEALMVRQMCKILKVVEEIADAKDVLPPRKFEQILQAVFDNVRRGDGLMFDFLFTDEYLHIVDKIAAQGNRLLGPSLLQIVEEGNRQAIFKVVYPREVLVFTAAILECLYYSLYQRHPQDTMLRMFEIASRLLEKALGAADGTLHLTVPTTS